MLGRALTPGLQPPAPTQQQPNGLGDVLNPAAPTGDPGMLANYNNWKTVLQNPAMLAGLAQFASQIVTPTGNGTASDVVGSVTSGLGAAGRAATVEEEQAAKERAEANALDQQQYQRQLDERRLAIAERTAARTGGSGGASSGRALTPAQRARAEYDAAVRAYNNWDELTQGPNPNEPPDIGVFIARAEQEADAWANGMNRGDYLAANAAARRAMVEAFAESAEAGQAFLDSLGGGPAPQAGAGPPPATTPAPATTPSAPVPPSAPPQPLPDTALGGSLARPEVAVAEDPVERATLLDEAQVLVSLGAERTQAQTNRLAQIAQQLGLTRRQLQQQASGQAGQ